MKFASETQPRQKIQTLITGPVTVRAVLRPPPLQPQAPTSTATNSDRPGDVQPRELVDLRSVELERLEKPVVGLPPGLEL